ncbi:MAG: helix-turn-helix transcriptional regulator [Oscillospiraceae bacterium]|nr:helix-turn-helix transcriptional regulator [Oscillospiraceae bacterium]
MSVSYRKLWHLLLDKKLKKIDLERKVGLSHYAVLQLSKDKDVSTEVLTKICDALDCGIDDIVDFIPANKR